MSFSSALESNMVEGWEHQYLSYEALKHHIKCALADADAVAVEQAPLCASTLSKVGRRERFMSLLNADLEKVVQFVGQLITDKNKQVLYMAGKASEVSDQPSLAAVSSLLRQAQSAAADVARMASFVFYNLEGFRKITEKYDESFNGNCSMLFLPMVRNHSCLRDDALDQIVIALSDVFTMIRSTSVPNAGGSTWEPPESFERCTTKYIISASDVIRVKLMIAEHLPILIVGREETTSANVPRDMLKVVNNSGVSSVYFDNPELGCYHDRLLREEGARLFRLRWYGDFRTPADGQHVFMERKTHHESWAVENSVKERFCMKASDVAAYLSGQAQPKVPANLASLADEIQAEIVSRKMRPVVRTVYQRSAFQSSASNEVRISIDTGLSFVDEACKTDSENGWCRNIPPEGVDGNEVMSFPWAVLEIKLTGGQPPWVETLLESGSLHEMQKFSKFSHGIATLYENSGALRDYPYWFNSIRCHGGELIVPSSGGSSANQTDAPSVPALSNEKFSAISLPTLLARAKIAPAKRVESVAAMPLVVHPSDDLEAAASAGGLRNQERKSSLGSRSMSWLSSLTSADALSKRSESGVPKRPGKVEPKTYFANERTFVQWISPVMGLIMVAMGLQSVADFLGSSRVAMLGAVLNGVGVVWMLFALYMYLRRLRKLQRHDATGWDARCGPIMLVGLLATVCVVGSVTMLAGAPIPTSATSPLTRAPDLPLVYTVQRFERGCLETPLSVNGVRPSSWELQEELHPGAFATDEQRKVTVRQWEATMGQFVVVDKFNVEERTEHKFCVRGVNCDHLVVRHRYISPNETYAIFKFAAMNDTYVARKAADGRRSRSKLELNAYCDRQNLGYSLYVADPLPVTSWKNTSVFDGLTRIPVMDDRIAVAQLIPLTVFHQTSYEYKLHSLYGADAKIVFQWSYSSESDRAFGRNPSRMEISVKLDGSVTLSAVRQAEGLLEALYKDSRG